MTVNVTVAVLTGAADAASFVKPVNHAAAPVAEGARTTVPVPAAASPTTVNETVPPAPVDSDCVSAPPARRTFPEAVAVTKPSAASTVFPY